MNATASNRSGVEQAAILLLTLGESEAAEMLHGSYDRCCAAVWERDGIVNKFIGDAVLAGKSKPAIASAFEAALLS